MVTLVIVWLVVGGAPAVALARLARRRAREWPAIAALLLGHQLAIVLLGFGLIALAYDGHVEDYGMKPVESTLPAIILLGSGTAVLAVVWISGLRRGSRAQM